MKVLSLLLDTEPDEDEETLGRRAIVTLEGLEVWRSDLLFGDYPEQEGIEAFAEKLREILGWTNEND